MIMFGIPLLIVSVIGSIVVATSPDAKTQPYRIDIDVETGERTDYINVAGCEQRHIYDPNGKLIQVKSIGTCLPHSKL